MTDLLPGTDRYLCPVRCGWHHDAPPSHLTDADWPAVQTAADLQDALGIATQNAALRTAATTEVALAEHLATHTTVDFVTALERLHGQVQQLAAARPEGSST